MRRFRLSHFARSACWLLVALVLISSRATWSNGSEPALGVEGIRHRLNAQAEKIESLHIHVRRTTAIAGEAAQLAKCPFAPVKGVRSGTDDVLEAFKSEMRYRRVMELHYANHSDVQAKPGSVDRDRHYLDEAKSWAGSVLLERNADAGSSRGNAGGVYRPRFDYRSTNKVTAKNHFPPSVYFFNTGLTPADPTCDSEADRNLTQVANIEALLSQVRFEVVTQESVTEEVPLVELKANYTIQLRLNGQVESQQLSDRIWLDKSHALAVAKRELRIGEWLASIVNEDFAEVASGFWLPRQSELSIWADAEKVDQQEPLVRSRTNLLQWIVNEVPDDLFTIALTPPQRYSLFDQAPAFHWTSGNAGFRVEGWAAKDTGVRVEHRDDAGQLVMLVIETPEQKITWRPSRNRVTVQLSHLKESNGYAYVSVNVAAREAIVRDTEMLTGMLQSRKELLGDRGEVERLFAYYPADPKLNFEGNLHHADPLILRNAPLPTVFFTRRHWFDLQTGLIVARQCGCKAGPAIDSTYVPETNIDYPAPESLSPDLFKFTIPADAKVTTLTQNATKSKPDNSLGEEP